MSLYTFWILKVHHLIELLPLKFIIRNWLFRFGFFLSQLVDFLIQFFISRLHNKFDSFDIQKITNEKVLLMIPLWTQELGLFQYSIQIHSGSSVFISFIAKSRLKFKLRFVSKLNNFLFRCLSLMGFQLWKCSTVQNFVITCYELFMFFQNDEDEIRSSTLQTKENVPLFFSSSSLSLFFSAKKNLFSFKVQKDRYTTRSSTSCCR